MRRLIFIFCIVLTFTSCFRARTIPDETLADIFCDMYIANAYVDENATDFQGRRVPVGGYARSRGAVTDMEAMDSIDIYEPILRNYGYRTRDFVHTLADFSKRKSAKIGDIVDKAIEKLDMQLAKYGVIIARIESLDSAAYANTPDTIVKDTVLKARVIADTADLILVYPATDGYYRIEYSYMLDTLDKNYGLRATHYLRDSLDMVVAQNSYSMFKGKRTRYSTELNSSVDARNLEIKFNNYNTLRDQNLKRPYLDVDSITIIHYPPKEVARKIYIEKLVKFQVLDLIFRVPELEADTDTNEEEVIKTEETEPVKYSFQISNS